MEELAGRTAVITGAGSGMGKAFALRFAAEGMAIVAADIQPDALAATVAELTAAGHQVAGIATDVADPDSVQRLAAAAYQRFGAVHLLCNNAGVEGYLDGPIWAATAKDWEWTVGVNFWSVVHGIRAFVPRMLAGGEPGHVVNTCSMTAVVSAGNMYAITKHAVLALSEVLALDLARRAAPIGVTALCPGIIATNLFRGSRNRPARLREDDADGGADQVAGVPHDRDAAAGREMRERMHATLAAGMPPAEVAAKLVDAVRTGTRYLLTDHDWDPRIQERHESIMGRSAGPLAPAPPGGPGAGVPPVQQARALEEIVSQRPQAGALEEIVSERPQAGALEEIVSEGQRTNGAADG
jgi:NAD(P)-dependent dehydrogenase (short-subunit alcohol dehydrogenase family)